MLKRAPELPAPFSDPPGWSSQPWVLPVRILLVGIKADLQQLQPIVVVLPEIVLEARVEQVNANFARVAGGVITAACEKGRFLERLADEDRRQSLSHVLEAGLSLSTVSSLFFESSSFSFNDF